MGEQALTDSTTRRAIEADCARQVNRYAILNDAADWEGVAALYHEAGRMARPSAPDVFIDGRDAILAAFQARPPRKSRHIVGNILVEVIDADNATAVSCIVLYQGAGGDAGDPPKMAPGQPLVGGFRDKLVRVGEEWLFAERVGWLDFTP